MTHNQSDLVIGSIKMELEDRLDAIDRKLKAKHLIYITLCIASISYAYIRQTQYVIPYSLLMITLTIGIMCFSSINSIREKKMIRYILFALKHGLGECNDQMIQNNEDKYLIRVVITEYVKIKKFINDGNQ